MPTEQTAERGRSPSTSDESMESPLHCKSEAICIDRTGPAVDLSAISASALLSTKKELFTLTDIRGTIGPRHDSGKLTAL